DTGAERAPALTQTRTAWLYWQLRAAARTPPPRAHFEPRGTDEQPMAEHPAHCNTGAALRIVSGARVALARSMRGMSRRSALATPRLPILRADAERRRRKQRVPTVPTTAAFCCRGRHVSLRGTGHLADNPPEVS